MRKAWISVLLTLMACVDEPSHDDDGPANGGAGVVSSGSPGTAYPGAGTGTHYWIDGAVGNDAGAGSQSLPWRTIERLESAAFAPGDLVHVKAGLYPIPGSLQLEGMIGTTSAWIGVQAEGAVVLRNAAAQNVVNVENCKYLFVKGFEITHDNGGAPYGQWDGVDGIKFQNSNSEYVSIDSCRIHDVGNVGIGSQAPEIRNVQVVGCEIYNCYTGLYWGYYEDPDKRYAHFGLIAKNYFHDCPPVDLDGTGYGLQIKGGSRGNVIEDNVLVNVGGETRAAIAIYHASTNQATYSDVNIVRRNFVRASRNEGIYAAEGALLENNILYDCRTFGVNVAPRNTGGWGVFYGNLTVRHNTVYRTTESNGVACSVSGASFAPTIVVANNLLVVTGGGQLAISGPSNFGGTGSQNYCYGGTTGSNLGAVSMNNLSALQSTVYGNAGFLRPSTGALAGNGTLAAAQDFNGTDRGGTVESGAYEYGSSGWTLADGFKP